MSTSAKRWDVKHVLRPCKEPASIFTPQTNIVKTILTYFERAINTYRGPEIDCDNTELD